MGRWATVGVIYIFTPTPLLVVLEIQIHAGRKRKN